MYILLILITRPHLNKDCGDSGESLQDTLKITAKKKKKKKLKKKSEIFQFNFPWNEISRGGKNI